MKTNRILSIIMLTGLLLFAGFTSNALAWVSAACDAISNQATLDYDVGGVNQTDILSDDPTTGAADDATVFYVGTLVDLTMSVISTPVTATGAGHVLTFQIDNDGNDVQRYGIGLYEGDNAGDGDDFDMGNIKVYYDTNSTYNASLLDGEVVIDDTSPATDGTILGITANVNYNSSIYIHVVSDVVTVQAAGDTAAYTVKAHTYQIDSANYLGADGAQGTETGNSGGGTPDSTSSYCTVPGVSVGVVPADGDADGAFTGVGGATDAANDGDYFATGEYIIATADISVTKNQSVLWDPVNGNSAPIAIPGAYIQYNIAILNAPTAGASATLNTITDTLQATNLAMDPNLFTGADLDPSDGPYEGGLGAGYGFKLLVSGSGRSIDGTPQYKTTAAGQGVSHDGSATGGVVSADYSILMPVDASGAGYTAGELKPGETVKLFFNTIIQ